MTLKKPAPAADTSADPRPTPPGQFEAPDEDTVQTDAANDEPEVEAAAPAPAPAPVPAVQSGGAVVTSNRNSDNEFAQKVLDMKGAADFSWGSHDVYKASQGKIKCGTEGKASPGTWIKVSMIAWDDRFEISPGSTGGKSKDYVAYSKDGKVIDYVIGESLRGWAGKTVSAYIAFCKEEGFDRCSDRPFVDIECIVHDSQKDVGLAGEVIQISLSSSSLPSFKKYQTNLKAKATAIKNGLKNVSIPEDPFTFWFVCEDAKNGDNEWTKLNVTDKQPTA